LDAISFPFKSTDGVMTKDNGVHILSEVAMSDNERNIRIIKAYTELLILALKLKARQKKLVRAGQQPFSAKNFYILNGYNSLAINDEEIKNLAIRDSLVKLGELAMPRATFDQLSEPTQLVILDLNYTGSLSSDAKAAILNKDSKALDAILSNKRPDKDGYESRNNQVRAWLQKASKTSPVKVQQNVSKTKTALQPTGN